MQKRITLLAIFAFLAATVCLAQGRKTQSGSSAIVRSGRRKEHQNRLLQPAHERPQNLSATSFLSARFGAPAPMRPPPL